MVINTSENIYSDAIQWHNQGILCGKYANTGTHRKFSRSKVPSSSSLTFCRLFFVYQFPASPAYLPILPFQGQKPPLPLAASTQVVNDKKLANGTKWL